MMLNRSRQASTTTAIFDHCLCALLYTPFFVSRLLDLTGDHIATAANKVMCNDCRILAIGKQTGGQHLSLHSVDALFMQLIDFISGRECRVIQYDNASYKWSFSVGSFATTSSSNNGHGLIIYVAYRSVGKGYVAIWRWALIRKIWVIPRYVDVAPLKKVSQRSRMARDQWAPQSS